MAFGFLDDLIRQPQLGRNGKGIALSGYADQQAVGGPQRLHTEFTAGIFHTGGGEGKNLQFTVMGGSHRADTAAVQAGKNRDG